MVGEEVRRGTRWVLAKDVCTGEGGRRAGRGGRGEAEEMVVGYEPGQKTGRSWQPTGKRDTGVEEAENVVDDVDVSVAAVCEVVEDVRM